MWHQTWQTLSGLGVKFDLTVVPTAQKQNEKPFHAAKNNLHILISDCVTKALVSVWNASSADADTHAREHTHTRTHTPVSVYRALICIYCSFRFTPNLDLYPKSITELFTVKYIVWVAEFQSFIDNAPILTWIPKDISTHTTVTHFFLILNDIKFQTLIKIARTNIWSKSKNLPGSKNVQHPECNGHDSW